jgi:hypothetical protein
MKTIHLHPASLHFAVTCDHGRRRRNEDEVDI